jgi:primosomal protein N' (replication factor Y)
VVGTRSAVFAPVRNPGLLVVDEEQDPSYKQQETPRYNGRDLAVLRAREAGAVLILGSATPSMESFHHASAGRYRLLELGGRVGGRPLPAVRVVDMREEYRRRKEIPLLAGPLTEAIAERLSRGEQVLILRNRRGFAVSVFCPGCGNRIQCDRCSITLTWHRRDDRLRCHGCDLERSTPDQCPHCGDPGLQFLGDGSERIEDELHRRFPEAVIARMDRDAVRRKGAHRTLLERFSSGKIDIMVGTQMIAKGHDFPGVTLVGILSADQSLGLPDFRAGERVFQLLTQVAGRAGRREKPGEVVLQAFDPEHPVVLEAIRQDYERFYRREEEYRRSLRYPPFTAMVQLLVSDPNPGKAAIWADQLADAIRTEGKGRLVITGPGLAPVERLRGKYRQQILVRSAGRRKMVEAVDRAMDRLDPGIPRRAVMVDVDPYNLL